MRLRDAARRFNDVQAYDAYTLKELFKCQFSSFDDHSADGATARRRTLNVPLEVVIPARSCVRLYDETWLVGSGTQDSFGGSVVRKHFGMKRATDLVSIATPAAVLTSTGTPVYVQKQYFKDTADTRTESDTQVSWNVFLSPAETIAEGMFIVADVLMRVRNHYLPLEGLRIAQCDDLGPISIVTATFTENGAYNSATDAMASVSVATSVILLDYTRLFRLATEADAAYAPGDVSILVRKAALTPVTGARLTMNSNSWRVLNTQSELDCWLLHCRIG
jgi:hypothetical protein